MAEAGDTEDAAQAELVREIFGNPLREVTMDPAWRLGDGHAILALARTIYAQQEFRRLPALADALERAGFAEPSLLAHLRARTTHVLGCWALDVLLGKG